MRIAIIVSEKALRDEARHSLLFRGHDVDVYLSLAETSSIVEMHYESIIIQSKLSDGDCLDYIAFVRSFSNIPILVLDTGRDECCGALAYSKGADGYFVRPFLWLAREAKLKILQKRMNRVDSSPFSDEFQGLNQQERNILTYLIEKAPSGVARSTLVQIAWPNNAYDEKDNALSVLVKRLRQKLGSQSKYLLTVRSLGYCWTRKN